MNIRNNVSLSEIIYYKIGGNADIVIEVSSIVDTQEALRYIHQRHISPVHVIGLGSNILLPDEGLRGVVLLMKPNNTLITIEQERLTSFAGNLFDDIIQMAFKNNLSGLGWAGGLPSTVGGAVRGNAGCFGTQTGDLVKSVDIINIDDSDIKIHSFTHSECQFSYRDSHFKQHNNLLIVSATFQLQKANDEEMQEQRQIYKENIKYRQNHHPLEYPSCGSVFKNIVDKKEVNKILTVWPDIAEQSKTKWHNKIAMAYVIGRLGFSGYTVGGAKVSEKHNNYISNLGTAQSRDVNTIIDALASAFIQKFNFEPALELEIIK